MRWWGGQQCSAMVEAGGKAALRSETAPEREDYYTLRAVSDLAFTFASSALASAVAVSGDVVPFLCLFHDSNLARGSHMRGMRSPLCTPQSDRRSSRRGEYPKVGVRGVLSVEGDASH